MNSNKEKDTIIMGDVHGEFGKLNSFINKKQPKMIIQLGDFGFFYKEEI